MLGNLLNTISCVCCIAPSIVKTHLCNTFLVQFTSAATESDCLQQAIASRVLQPSEATARTLETAARRCRHCGTTTSGKEIETAGRHTVRRRRDLWRWPRAYCSPRWLGATRSASGATVVVQGDPPCVSRAAAACWLIWPGRSFTVKRGGPLRKIAALRDADLLSVRCVSACFLDDREQNGRPMHS